MNSDWDTQIRTKAKLISYLLSEYLHVKENREDVKESTIWISGVYM